MTFGDVSSLNWALYVNSGSAPGEAALPAVFPPEEQKQKQTQADQSGKQRPVGGSADSQLRRPPVAVNEHIVQRNIAGDHDEVDNHDGQRLSASAPERAECGVEKKKHIADGKDFEITDFLRSDVRIMPEERKKRIRPEISCCQDRSTGQRKENALPDRRPDTSRGARSGILRYERSRETDGSEKKAGDCKTGQSAGETCGNRLLRIIRKHDAVGKQIEGVSRRAHNQRQRDPQDFKQSPFRREKLVLLNFHKLLPYLDFTPDIEIVLAFFQRFAPILKRFAFRGAEFQLDPAAREIKFQRNQRVSLLLHPLGELQDLLLVQQQNTRPHRGVIEAVSMGIGRYIHIVEQNLPVFDFRKRILKRDGMHAAALHFRSAQGNPGFQTVNDLVVVKRLLVARDDAVTALFVLSLCRHCLSPWSIGF